MATLIPSLDEDGFIKDGKTKLITMFKHAMVAEHNQSTIYAGNITSLRYIVATSSRTPDQLADAIRVALTKYFYTAFASATVQVTHKDVENTQFYKLFINISVTDYDGAVYDLGDTILIDTTNLTMVIEELQQ
jgi:hypothetical protein